MKEETEKMVKANNDQEIPGVVVGGNILPGAPISGTLGGDTEERLKTTVGSLSIADPKAGNGDDLHDKISTLKKEGHLFNLVAKGFQKDI